MYTDEDAFTEALEAQQQQFFRGLSHATGSITEPGGGGYGGGGTPNPPTKQVPPPTQPPKKTAPPPPKTIVQRIVGSGGGGGGGGSRLLGPSSLGQFQPLPDIPGTASSGSANPIVIVVLLASVGIGGYLLWHKLHQAHHDESVLDKKGE